MIQKEKCTALLGTPTMYVDLLRVMNQTGIKMDTVEVAAYGGALCAPATASEMNKTLGIKRLAVSFKEIKAFSI